MQAAGGFARNISQNEVLNGVVHTNDFCGQRPEESQRVNHYWNQQQSFILFNLPFLAANNCTCVTKSISVLLMIVASPQNIASL